MGWPTFALAAAGALGVLARHAVQRAVPRTWGVPWGTFVVNVSGALATGLLLGLVARRLAAPAWAQEAVFVGFLGGYTTFSALSAETLLLLETHRYATAALYAFGTLGTGLVAVAAGLWLGRIGS